jgi:hypothetical protein
MVRMAAVAVRMLAVVVPGLKAAITAGKRNSHVA